MKDLILVRGKNPKSLNDENTCLPTLDAGVLKNEVRNLGDIIKEHKENTEKNFLKLEKNIEKDLSEIKKYMEKEFELIKEDFGKQEEKMEELEKEINAVKISLSSVIAKSGVLFAIFASLGAFGLNVIAEKIM